MGLSVTNTNTLNLLNIINKTSLAQSKTLTQLSTGSRLNRGADNPAGLLAVESLNAELTSVNAAIDNNMRADSMLNTADGALKEVGSLLSDIESLVAASASDGGLSASELAANQSQIDSAIESIDRIVKTTSFNGKRLLDGSQGIQVTGLANDTADNLRVYSRGSSADDFDITATVKTAAAVASGTITVGAAATLSSETALVISGTEGTTTITLGVGDDKDDIKAAINAASATTGVTASATAAGAVVLKTSGSGSDEFVSAKVLSGGGLSSGSSLNDVSRAEGVDAVVTINGRDVTADGSDVYYSANGFSLSFSLGTALDAAGNTETFTIKAAGGMTFQLGSDSNTRSTIGVDSLATYALGGGDSGGMLSDLKSGGTLDLAEKSSDTLKVIRKAISDVAGARGRIGGFQKFQVQTSINSLNETKSALTDAKGVIADTDFAMATSELNRQSVLLNSGISLLGLANQQSAQILSLLG